MFIWRSAAIVLTYVVLGSALGACNATPANLSPTVQPASVVPAATSSAPSVAPSPSSPSPSPTASAIPSLTAASCIDGTILGKFEDARVPLNEVLTKAEMDEFLTSLEAYDFGTDTQAAASSDQIVKLMRRTIPGCVSRDVDGVGHGVLAAQGMPIAPAADSTFMAARLGRI